MNQFPRKSGEYRFEIVMRRHDTRSTIMMSNRLLEDWGKHFQDAAAATAILDRFLEHSETITIQGKSYRLKGKKRVVSKSPCTRPVLGISSSTVFVVLAAAENRISLMLVGGGCCEILSSKTIDE